MTVVLKSLALSKVDTLGRTSSDLGRWSTASLARFRLLAIVSPVDSSIEKDEDDESGRLPMVALSCTGSWPV